MRDSSFHHEQYHTQIYHNQSRTMISVIHLKVHHIYKKRGSHDQNFGIHRESIIEVNNEVIRVSKSFSEAAHPLLGNPAHLPSLHVQDLELHVTTEVYMTGGASDLQQLETMKKFR